jgi:quinol monooxygenase YgiN
MRSTTGVLLGLAMTALGVTASAHAADTAFHTVTYVEVVAPSAAGAATLLRQYRDASSKDEGNLRFEVLQRIDRPGQFTVVAAWRDDKAFEAHRAGAAARQLREGLQPLLASPNDERSHTGLSIGAVPVASAAGAIYAVTHVDVIPPRKDDGVALLRRLAEDSRKDAGSLRFDVLQQTNRPNHFTVVEVWQDPSALDAHESAAHTRRFREQLAPMSGALYDQRLYRLLGSAN